MLQSGDSAMLVDEDKSRSALAPGESYDSGSGAAWRHCGGGVDRRETSTACQPPESIHCKKLLRLITA
jgi:hypothetical protein